MSEVNLRLRMKLDLHNAIKDVAMRHGRSMNSEIVYILGMSLGQVEARCRHCYKVFTKGPNGERRADAIFCTEECKIRNKSLSRSLR